MSEKVSREQAIAEFENWAYTTKKLKKRLIENDPDMVSNKEFFIENIIDGTFAIDSDGHVTHCLSVPISDSITELKYKPRLQVFEMSRMKEYKNDDSTGKAMALLSVLSGQNKGVIAKMDSVDFIAASQLVSFFMVG